MRWKAILLAAALALVSAAAFAQTTYVNPNPFGGYTAITPGQGTTFINPNPFGGYTAITPGQGTTYVQPQFNGGWTVRQMPQAQTGNPFPFGNQYAPRNGNRW